MQCILILEVFHQNIIYFNKLIIFWWKMAFDVIIHIMVIIAIA